MDAPRSKENRRDAHGRDRPYANVIEAVLNHVSGHKAGVAGIYNRSTYVREKRAALDLWANHWTDVGAGRRGVIVALRVIEQ